LTPSIPVSVSRSTSFSYLSSAGSGEIAGCPSLESKAHPAKVSTDSGPSVHLVASSTHRKEGSYRVPRPKQICTQRVTRCLDFPFWPKRLRQPKRSIGVLLCSTTMPVPMRAPCSNYHPDSRCVDRSSIGNGHVETQGSNARGLADYDRLRFCPEVISETHSVRTQECPVRALPASGGGGPWVRLKRNCPIRPEKHGVDRALKNRVVPARIAFAGAARFFWAGIRLPGQNRTVPLLGRGLSLNCRGSPIL